MTFEAGNKVGVYDIIAPIGAGGMGQVYRARDRRLGRDVAIKVSVDMFTEHFEREARVIASLNHLNVCTLHAATGLLVSRQPIYCVFLQWRARDSRTAEEARH